MNGALVSNIVIDTGAVATDTIDYVATDQNGLTATSTRTVLIEFHPVNRTYKRCVDNHHDFGFNYTGAIVEIPNRR